MCVTTENNQRSIHLNTDEVECGVGDRSLQFDSNRNFKHKPSRIHPALIGTEEMYTAYMNGNQTLSAG